MNQLKVGAVLNYIIILLNILVGLLYTPYMLRMMGQSEYGLYSLVASVISYLTVLDLGMGNAIVRYTAKFRAENKTKEQYEMFGMFLIIYILIGIVAFVLGLGLFFNIEELFGTTMTTEEIEKAQLMMMFLIFNVAITFPMSIFGSIITAYEHFVFPKTINIIRIILNTVIMIYLLKLGYKAVAMVILQTFFNILTLFINLFYCKYKLKIKIFFSKFNWNFLKEIAIYSFWIFLNVIMDRIYWSTGQFILGAFVGTAAVAIFAVAIQLEHMYLSFSTAISSLFLPKVTSMITHPNNNHEISDLFIRTGRIQCIIVSFILIIFILFGRSFIHLWAGTEYDDAYIITLLFFISLFPPLIQNLGITILQARNQMKFRSLLYIAIAITSLIFQIILAKKYGAIGCAISITVALLIGQGVIMNIYYNKKQSLDIRRFWHEISKMSIAPITLCVITSFLLRYVKISSWISMGIVITIFTCVYVCILFKFSMNQSEQRLFLKPVKLLLKKRQNQND